jgi:RNA recognition motif-containing protein
MDGWGVVDKVFSDYYNSNKQKMARVRICTYRNPRLGDKFASRHGQKGVIGMILPQEDMPFTKDGIVPDIIINPHAIPSRMTLGQLVECVMGKSCSILGTYADATPFTNIDNNEIFNILEHNCNFQRHGDEILYSGINGKQLSTKIFIGPTYYQRLKHMVKDKINSRATGAVSLKTKQPPSGRSVGGGLRIGEMERDAILSHGALQFLKETMLERSDKYSTYVSTYSGMTSIVNPRDNKYVCPSVDGPLEFNDEHGVENDNSRCDIVKINIPYNTNLMIQECNAMGIALRFIIDKESNYKKLDLPAKSTKFELQDSDKRKFIISKKEDKTKRFIPPTPKNKEKFINSMKHNKIIVSELPTDITKGDLKKLFSSVGSIFEININNDNNAIIIYTTDDHAKEAITTLNNVLLDGNRIVVSLYTDNIRHKPFIEPLKIYGNSIFPSLQETFIPPTQAEYDAAREERLENARDYYETIQSPIYTPNSPFNFTPNNDKDFNENQEENNSPDYSPDTKFKVPDQYNQELLNTYGATKYDPFEQYVPDNSFMKELEKKEQAIKDKYASNVINIPMFGDVEGNNLLPTPQSPPLPETNENNENNENNQKGGGNKLDFSEINLGNDNLLSEVNLEGGSSVNLSDLNNMTLNVHDNPVSSQPSPEIKHITINLTNNPTTSNEPTTSNVDTTNIANDTPLDIDVGSTDDSALNDLPTENLIDNLEISTLNEVIL